MSEYNVDERLRGIEEEAYESAHHTELPVLSSFKKHSVCYVLQSEPNLKTGSIFRNKKKFLNVLEDVYNSAKEFGRDYPIAHTIVLEKNRSIYNKRIRIENLDFEKTWSLEIRSEEDIRKLESML